MRSLSSAEVWEFFDSKPGWAALTTLDEDGLPHTVAIGYFRLGEVVYCGCRAGTRKCRNLQRDSRVTLMLESGRGHETLKGVMFQGRGRVIEEEGELLQLKRELARLRGEAEPTEISAGIAYLEIKPLRIRSWTR